MTERVFFLFFFSFLNQFFSEDKKSSKHEINIFKEIAMLHCQLYLCWNTEKYLWLKVFSKTKFFCYIIEENWMFFSFQYKVSVKHMLCGGRKSGKNVLSNGSSRVKNHSNVTWWKLWQKPLTSNRDDIAYLKGRARININECHQIAQGLN